jgi:hypothetical protein
LAGLAFVITLAAAAQNEVPSCGGKQKQCEHEWQELRDARTSPLFFRLPSVESDVADRIKTKTQADLFKTKTHKARPSLFFGLPSIDSDEPDQIKAKTK